MARPGASRALASSGGGMQQRRTSGQDRVRQKRDLDRPRPTSNRHHEPARRNSGAAAWAHAGAKLPDDRRWRNLCDGPSRIGDRPRPILPCARRGASWPGWTPRRWTRFVQSPLISDFCSISTSSCMASMQQVIRRQWRVVAARRSWPGGWPGKCSRRRCVAHRFRPPPTPRRVRVCAPPVASRRSGAICLESSRPTMRRLGLRMTAAATTGPNSAPRPASSRPAMRVQPSLRAARSKREEHRRLIVGDSSTARGKKAGQQKPRSPRNAQLATRVAASVAYWMGGHT